MSYSLYQFLKQKNSRRVVSPSDNSNCMNAASNEANGFDSRDVNGRFQFNMKYKSGLKHDHDSQLIDLKRETLRMESLRKEMKTELSNMHESLKKDLIKEMQNLLKIESRK